MSTSSPEAAGSRAATFQRILAQMGEVPGVTGTLLVAPDGLVIAARLPPGRAVEPLSALAATLGRELELRASRLRRGAFQVAHFSGSDGTVFVGGTAVGFFVVLASPGVNRETIRQGLRGAAETLRKAWRR